nr:MAG TPA: hypothetical protein [Caudoviricetes sp.]
MQNQLKTNSNEHSGNLKRLSKGYKPLQLNIWRATLMVRSVLLALSYLL